MHFPMNNTPTLPSPASATPNTRRGRHPRAGGGDALSVKPGVLAMDEVPVVYGNYITAITERTEDERTETTITQKQYAVHFKCW